jgi:hypothetical protein
VEGRHIGRDGRKQRVVILDEGQHFVTVRVPLRECTKGAGNRRA